MSHNVARLTKAPMRVCVHLCPLEVLDRILLGCAGLPFGISFVLHVLYLRILRHWIMCMYLRYRSSALVSVLYILTYSVHRYQTLDPIRGADTALKYTYLKLFAVVPVIFPFSSRADVVSCLRPVIKLK